MLFLVFWLSILFLYAWLFKSIFKHIILELNEWSFIFGLSIFLSYQFFPNTCICTRSSIFSQYLCQVINFFPISVPGHQFFFPLSLHISSLWLSRLWKQTTNSTAPTHEKANKKHWLYTENKWLMLEWLPNIYTCIYKWINLQYTRNIMWSVADITYRPLT